MGPHFMSIQVRVRSGTYLFTCDVFLVKTIYSIHYRLDEADLATAPVELLFSIVSTNDGIVDQFSSTFASGEVDTQKIFNWLHLISTVDLSTPCTSNSAVPNTNAHIDVPYRLAKTVYTRAGHVNTTPDLSCTPFASMLRLHAGFLSFCTNQSLTTFIRLHTFVNTVNNAYSAPIVMHKTFCWVFFFKLKLTTSASSFA